MSKALGDAIKHIRKELTVCRERARTLETTISTLESMCRHEENMPSVDAAGVLHYECRYCGHDRVEKPQKVTSGEAVFPPGALALRFD